MMTFEASSVPCETNVESVYWPLPLDYKHTFIHSKKDQITSNVLTGKDVVLC